MQKPIDQPKPVTVCLYGLKELTLPGYLIMEAAIWVVFLVVFVVAHHILTWFHGFALTKAGSRMVEELNFVRWNLEWLPFLALIVIAFEVVEFTIMLVVFRHRYQQHKSLCARLPSDSLETDRTCRNPWIVIASNRLDELAELSQNTWPDRISLGLEKHA